MASEALEARLKKLYLKRTVENKEHYSLTGRYKYLSAKPTYRQLAESHVLWVKSESKPFVKFQSEYMKVANSFGTGQQLPNSDTENNLKFDLSGNKGDFYGDMVLHISLKSVGSTTGSILYKYCAFPGVRINKTTIFESAGNIIDSYTSRDVISQFYNFGISEDKFEAWSDCMGQEKMIFGEYYHPYNYTKDFFQDRVNDTGDDFLSRFLRRENILPQ